MTILVTGGAGFIGSHLIQALQAAGHSVVNVDEVNDYYDPAFKRQNLALLKPHAFYEIDVRDAQKLEQVFQENQIDAIVHLGARAGVRHSLQNPELYQTVNYGGTKNLLALANQYQVKQFIFGSTSAVYGHSTPLPFSETATDLVPLSPYAATKLAAEALLRSEHDRTQLPTTILRFFTVYGERGRPDMAPYLFTEAILKGLPIKKYGDGTSSRDYTYVGDIVAGIMAALAKPFAFEIINLGNNHSVTLNEFIATAERITGKIANLIPSPIQPGEMQHTLANISKAQELLGYQPTTALEQGLQKFVSWYTTNRL